MRLCNLLGSVVTCRTSTTTAFSVASSATGLLLSACARSPPASTDPRSTTHASAAGTDFRPAATPATMSAIPTAPRRAISCPDEASHMPSQAATADGSSRTSCVDRSGSSLDPDMGRDLCVRLGADPVDFLQLLDLGVLAVLRAVVEDRLRRDGSVSYTHLTLPTIYSV